MGCPSDRWFFGSVFVFLVAVGMLAGGAVNMQLASDDPRTPRVKSYDGYVDAWQNTHFAEYNTKYTSVPATATLHARGGRRRREHHDGVRVDEARIRRHRRDRPQGYPQRLQEAQQAPRPVRVHRRTSTAAPRSRRRRTTTSPSPVGSNVFREVQRLRVRHPEVHEEC